MTSLRRFILVSAVVLGASCGGSSTPVEVAALSDAQAVSLCREFITKACRAGYPSNEPACTSCDPCGASTSASAIRAHCGDGITVDGVRACMDSGFDMPTCTGPERGGCMFDVADELCP
jgi:hypothetical protein